MYKYKITIAVAIYNVEKYLEKCLNSLLNQTEKNGYEILLINDGSTDSSREICEKYIKNGLNAKLMNKDNEGVSKTRNLIIKIAQGEYILFIDGDDYLEKNCLELLIEEININKVDLICFGFNWVNKGKKKNDSRFEKETIYYNENWIKNLVYDYKINTSVWNKLFKLEIIRSNKIFFENLYKWEDIMFIIKYLDFSKEVKIMSNTLYNYVYRDNSLSNIKDIKYYEDFLFVLFFILENINNKKTQELYRYVVTEYVYIIREVLKNKNYKKNREIKEWRNKIEKRISLFNMIFNFKLSFKIKIRYLKIKEWRKL